MAIDPRISLATTPVRASQSISIFENALANAANRDLAAKQQAIQDAEEKRRQQLFDLNFPGMQAQANLASSPMGIKQQVQAQLVNSVAPLFASNDSQGIAQAYTQAAQFLSQNGGDQVDVQQLQQDAQDVMTPEGFAQHKQEIDAYLAQKSGSGISVSQKEYNDAVEVAKKDPKGITLEGKAALIKLGLAPRAIGNADITTTDRGNAQDVAGTKQIQAQGTEAGKLKAQMKFKPQVEQAIAEAKAVGLGKGNEIVSYPSNLSALRDGLDRADNVISKATDALSKIGFFSSGFVGKALSNLPNTDAYALRQTVDTIKANLSFDRLSQMRKESKSGGALGNVSEMELKLLGAAVDNLDIGQSDAQLSKNMANVITHYEKYKKAQIEDIKALAARTGNNPDNIPKDNGFGHLWGG